MLDQENHNNAVVEMPANNIATNNASNSTHDTNGGNKLPANSNGTLPSNLLSDHDYCSPNKNSHNKSLTTSKGLDDHSEDVSKQGSDFNSQSTLSATECHASTSSSPIREVKNEIKNISDLHSLANAENDDNICDDSSSSSSITSDDSTMDLIIASEGSDRRARPTAPQDTPSVSKPKLGRRPLLKADSEKVKLKNQKELQQTRIKRPRQSISVTDKSQWITGEEQIDSALSDQPTEVRDKRQRKEVHDPIYSHFTSSDYSSSDAESDQDSDSEDDPNRPWCVCNKPDDGNFMISCDICEYWFHGSCVGMTQSLSQRRTKEGKDWNCPDCDHALASGTPRNAIPSKIVKKEKKKSSKKSGKRRGRPRKSNSPARELSTRFSLRSAKKNDSIDSRASSGKNSGKSNARSESFEKFEDSERLKELIRERKKAFFRRHRLSEQLRAEKMKEFGRKSMTASLGTSMNSLVSNTNSPNMNNLPINIKSEHKERSKPNIVLHINNKKDGTSESGVQRIVTTIVKKRKHSESSETKTDEPKTEPAPDALNFLDSTKDHKNHIFDINCKICTKQKKDSSEDELEVKRENTETPEPIPAEKNEQQDKPPEPKRLRISIDSKLDPEKILRLKEPLIKPVEQPTDSVEYSPSRISPAGQSNSDDADEEDVEDVYDPETSTIASRKSASTDSSIVRSPNETCWTGTITMPEVGKFAAAAKPVSGNSDFLQNDFNENILVCGRIAPDMLFSFIKKLKSTTKNQLILVQLHPLTENDKSNFDTLFDYLYTRNRCGVINNNSQIVRDCYILPIQEGKNVPDILKPIKGPGLDRKQPNCLLCLLVKRPMRPPSASGSASSYTPAQMS